MALSHRVLASWYTQLAQQLDAGISLVEALRTGGMAPRAADAMVRVLDRGGKVDDALRAAARWFPRVDWLTISAAAAIGQMPSALRNLAERHAQLHVVRQRLVLACLYPFAVMHAGLLLMPLTHMIDWEKGFHWDLVVYLRGVMAIVVPVWIAGAVIVVVVRAWPRLGRAIANTLPALGAYVRAQALADLAFSLAGFVSAGVPIGDAWAAAASISASPRVRTAAEAMHATARRGAPPGSEMAAWPVFPLDFSVRYRTAEQTGQLDRALFDLNREYQARASRALTIATMLYPAVLFLTVAAMVVYGVLSFYAGYLRMLTKLAE